MFAAVRKSMIDLESRKNASLDQKEWGFDFACSDEIRLVREVVGKDVEPSD